MDIYNVLVTACWIALAVYWVVSAFWAKRYVRRNPRNWSMRLVIVLVAIVAAIASRPHQSVIPGISEASAIRMLGVVLCVAGIGTALWARVHLGRNWGMPMTLKENPELVMTGPYAHVRHPIYSGIMLAALGSALAVSLYWLVALLAYSAYFVYSARTEEKIMREQFPEQYPQYMKRTKMLIPFML